MLIKRTRNVNATDERGWTALSYAIQEGNIGFVKLLISNKTDVNFKAKNGHTAFSLAKHINSIFKNKTDKFSKIINLLKKAGAR